MVAAVGLANRIANWLESRDGEETAIPDDPLMDELLADMGMDREMLGDLPDTVDLEVDKAKVFLRVAGKD
jgi:hypothetical protein